MADKVAKNCRCRYPDCDRQPRLSFLKHCMWHMTDNEWDELKIACRTAATIEQMRKETLAKTR